MTFAEFESAYWNLTAELDFPRFVGPVNAIEQRQRFFDGLASGNSADPDFRYATVDAPLTNAGERIVDLRRSLDRFQGHPLHEAYVRLLTKLAESVSLMRLGRSNVAFPGMLTSMWGVPTEQEVAEAKTFLCSTAMPSVPDETVTAGEFAAALRGAMPTASGDWTIEESRNLSARVSVNSLRKKIRLRAGAMFSEADVRRLLVHEIGVHVTRFENGAIQPFLLLRYGFPDFLATEEGLAVCAEERAGLIDVGVLRTYAGRIAAAHAAIQGSFRDVYGELVEWFDPSQAFEITQRVKRGLHDTGCPGGYTKDLVYFRGYRDVQQHLAQGRDLTPLWVGKVGLEDVPLIEELLESRLLLPPKHVPSYIQAACEGS